ncbi:MAG TPA: preprotein translocase subunit SecE [Clostridia bacterium]|nr:preprotein translocase subunit SecE [Clostridia bacterium]
MAKNTNDNGKLEKKKDRGPKKENIFVRIGRFLREVVGELKKLTWPTKKELVSYTLTVMGFILILAVIIYALDFVFGSGLGLIANIGSGAAATPTASAVASASPTALLTPTPTLPS